MSLMMQRFHVECAIEHVRWNYAQLNPQKFSITRSIEAERAAHKPQTKLHSVIFLINFLIHFHFELTIDPWSMQKK